MSDIIKKAFDNVNESDYNIAGVKLALYSIDYAVMTLEKERDLYLKLISSRELKDKEHISKVEKRLKQINKAIDILDKKNLDEEKIDFLIYEIVNEWCSGQYHVIPEQNKRYLMDVIKDLINKL